MTDKFDLVVVGGGSAGVRAARLYASAGHKVALVEKQYLGGTCVNAGCIPKKLFANAAHFAHDFELAKSYGWNNQNLSFDWSVLVNNVASYIKKLQVIYRDNLIKNKVNILYGEARFITNHSLEVSLQSNKTKILSAEKYIIATGGTPVIPSCEGSEHVITSDNFFNLPALPKSVVVLGGGYIALELASLLNGLGTQVTILQRSELLLRGLEEEMVKKIHANMLKQGVKVILNSQLVSLKKIDDSLQVFYDSNGESKELNAECVLAATGRSPNIGHLNLELAGVKKSKNGGVKVDGEFCSTNPNIYALGDAIIGSHDGHLALTPVAIAQAKWLTSHWLQENNSSAINYCNTPTAVFVQPTAASVGLTENEARKRYVKIDCYTTEFTPLPEGLQTKEQAYKVWMKLIIERESDKLLGVHVIGDKAEEIAQMAAVWLQAGITHKLLNSTLPLHPSTTEELVLL